MPDLGNTDALGIQWFNLKCNWLSFGYDLYNIKGSLSTKYESINLKQDHHHVRTQKFLLTKNHQQ